MIDRLCTVCKQPINLLREGAKYCSTACSQKAYRMRKKADRSRAAMFAAKRFVRARRKLPLQVTGALASSTNPRTWAHYDDVQAGPGDGFGFMLGDGWGCYDLDGVTDDQIKLFLESITEPVIFVERSISGNGAHIFIQAPEAHGWRKIVQGMNVERYTRARFIRMTGEELNL